MQKQPNDIAQLNFIINDIGFFELTNMFNDLYMFMTEHEAIKFIIYYVLNECNDENDLSDDEITANIKRALDDYGEYEGVNCCSKHICTIEEVSPFNIKSFGDNNYIKIGAFGHKYPL